MVQRFIHHRRVAYHETDALAIVHHSNHIRFFEEARVEWLRDRGLIDIHKPLGPLTFAVTSLDCHYAKPLRFDDLMETHVEARTEGVRIHIRYAIWLPRLASFVAYGTTELVPLDEEFRVARLPKHARDVFAQETWSPSWPPPNPTGGPAPAP